MAIGAGAGQRSIPLARDGHEVTLLDLLPGMLAEARRRLDRERDEVYRRVRLVEGPGARAADVLGVEAFDAVLCHGVVVYLENPSLLVEILWAVAHPGGVVSLLAKIAAALAVRPALKGRYREALALLDADRGAGGLGMLTRGDTVEGLSRIFEKAGVERWYGVRVFTDHLGDWEPGPDLPDDILELEWEARRRGPYRSVARLIHLVRRKRLDGMKGGLTAWRGYTCS